MRLTFGRPTARCYVSRIERGVRELSARGGVRKARRLEAGLMKTQLAKLANRIYAHAPTLYRAMYNLYKRWSDRAERRLLRQLITLGMTVLDIGASIGIYTEFLAKLVGVENPQALLSDLSSFGYEPRTIEDSLVPDFPASGADVYVNLVAARSLRSSSR